jgi:hypothetical protein
MAQSDAVHQRHLAVNLNINNKNGSRSFSSTGHWREWILAWIQPRTHKNFYFKSWITNLASIADRERILKIIEYKLYSIFFNLKASRIQSFQNRKINYLFFHPLQTDK